MGTWHPLPTCSAHSPGSALPSLQETLHHVPIPNASQTFSHPGCQLGAALLGQPTGCAGQVLCYGQPAPVPTRAQPLTPGTKVCWTPTLAGSVALGVLGCAETSPREAAAQESVWHKCRAPGPSLPVTWAAVRPPLAPSCVHARTLPSHSHPEIWQLVSMGLSGPVNGSLFLCGWAQGIGPGRLSFRSQVLNGEHLGMRQTRMFQGR